jgi:hypothetical protein
MWAAANHHPGLRRHLALAFVSIPLWWYFEAVNLRTGNWEYIGRDSYSRVEFAVLASIAFATVVPALAAAGELADRLLSRQPANASGGVPEARRTGVILIALGVAAEAAVLLYPVGFYPLVWVAPFFLVDGAMILAGGPSISLQLLRGSIERAAIFGASGLFCGFLWEFWNFRAFPKWEYHIPLLDFLPIFEMPVLGYGGYVPFAWAVLQLVALLDIWTRQDNHRDAWRVGPGDTPRTPH